MNDRRPMKMVQKISFLCCQFCSYKTRFTGNLAKHIRTHTGERPFECQFCGKRFASKSNYNTHVVIHSTIGSSSLKIPFGEKAGMVGRKLGRVSSSRPGTSKVNSEIVRSVPMVKTLLSSNRSSSRSAVQKLSPIGSFLMPDQANSSFSHTALYSSINFSQFGTSLSNRNDYFIEAGSSSFADDPAILSNNESRNVEDPETSPEVIEVTNADGEENRQLIEDVKPTIFDILSALPGAGGKTSFARKVRNSQLIASIKEEAVDNVVYTVDSEFSRPSRRMKPGFSEDKVVHDLDVESFNGHSSGYDTNYRVPDSLTQLDDDPGQLHTRMLIDTLIKEARLFRCESCNILFPEYSMYVLHLGCHGNEGTYQCHFCRQFFDDKFGFTTHFVRCPSEPSDCH